MRPDYCPIKGEPCQSLCDKPCSANRLKINPEQAEPVAWLYTNNAGIQALHIEPSLRLDADIKAAQDYPDTDKVTPLYAAPPRRKPLTDEEIGTITTECLDPWSCARAVEKAHGIGEE